MPRPRIVLAALAVLLAPGAVAARAATAQPAPAHAQSTAVATPAGGPSAPQLSEAARARLAYRGMEGAFLRFRSGLYRARPGRDNYARAWPFSQALAATVARATLPGAGAFEQAAVSARVRALQRYWDPQLRLYRPRPTVGALHGGNAFVDDNEWIALELVSVARMHLWSEAQPRAQQIFRAVVGAWDRESSHACPGGVFWTLDPAIRDRNAVSTATGAELALALYALNHRPAYLRWGVRMYSWVTRCLTAPDGLLADHLSPTGLVEPTEWTYNQGTMIGAGVLLARITRNSSYLERAETLARGALAHFDAKRLAAEPPPFAAIFFHNLLALEQVDPDPDLRHRSEQYADDLWARADPRTGLLRGQPSLLDQASLVRLQAALAGRCPTPCS